jgi:acyl-CoA thioesterase-1
MRSGVFRSPGPARGAWFSVARAATVGISLVALGACQVSTPTSGPSSSPALSSPVGTDPAMTSEGSRLRYVALGDSYTIGTSVVEGERWPNQLIARVPGLELAANLGVNGFTSRDVIEVELPQLDAHRPDVITLLIGVNDVVQGVPTETYRANVVRILDDAVDRVGAGRVLVVTTPDYTVTPSGSDYGDPVQQSAGIRANNAIITEVARGLGIRVADIYDLSLGAATDHSLVAGDGLHPSGHQYELWVDRIAPIVEAMLAG